MLFQIPISNIFQIQTLYIYLKKQYRNRALLANVEQLLERYHFGVVRFSPLNR